MTRCFSLSVSLGAAGVVVGHEAESVHHRRQLFKLLPAKHPRLPGAEDQRHEGEKESSVAFSKQIFNVRQWRLISFTWLQQVEWRGRSLIFSPSESRTRVSPDGPAPCRKRKFTHVWLSAGNCHKQRPAAGRNDALRRSRTHFRLLPPSWLHSSRVNPSKPSVWKTTGSLHTQTHTPQTNKVL